MARQSTPQARANPTTMLPAGTPQLVIDGISLRFGGVTAINPEIRLTIQIPGQAVRRPVNAVGVEVQVFAQRYRGSFLGSPWLLQHPPLRLLQVAPPH